MQEIAWQILLIGLAVVLVLALIVYGVAWLFMKLEPNKSSIDDQ